MCVTPPSPSRIRVRCNSSTRGEAREQTAPLAEQHRDDVELELVEDTGGKSELCGSGAVDEHVLVTRSLLGPSHRSRYVVHIR